MSVDVDEWKQSIDSCHSLIRQRKQWRGLWQLDWDQSRSQTFVTQHDTGYWLRFYIPLDTK